MAKRARSRDGGAARRALDLVRGEAARADLHLRHLAVDEDARDLEVRLPRAARALFACETLLPNATPLPQT